MILHSSPIRKLFSTKQVPCFHVGSILADLKLNMPSYWPKTMLSFPRRAKQQDYIPVTEYSDDSSVDEEKGELLHQNRNSFSASSDDGMPTNPKSPSEVLNRVSFGLNVVLLCTIIALVVAGWPELTLKWDEFDNGLFKRTSQPCTFGLLLLPNLCQFTYNSTPQHRF